MLGRIVRKIGGVLYGASMNRHPSAIALAFAFGLAVGLMPKENLFVLSLIAAACFLRMNYLLAIATVIIVSYGSRWTDGATGWIGKWMLESTYLQWLWMRLATWPIMPWFRWNNTVVLGSFIVGVASIIPIYVLWLLATLRLARFQKRNQLDLIVEEVNDYQIQIRAEQNKRQLVKAKIESNSDRRRSIKKRQNQRRRIDETPQSEASKPNIVDSRPEPALAMMTNELPSQTSTAVLHETVIEIVRYRPKDPTLSTDSDDYQYNPRDLLKSASPMNSNTVSIEKMPPPNVNLNVAERPTTIPSTLESQPVASASVLPTSIAPSSEKPREEALRYLLWHLSGMHRQPRHQEPVS